MAIVEKGKVINEISRKISDFEKENITESIEQIILENIIKIIEAIPNIDGIENRKIEHIGIAIPGTVRNGYIEKCVNLYIENYDIVQNLNKIITKYIEDNKKEEYFEKIPVEIKLKNDAKCAAIAENKYGALKGYENSVFLTLGTGIGGAVIISNQLLEGNNFPGYEFGHMIIQKEGIKCNCGKQGCFEAYANMKLFRNNLKQKLNLNEYTTSRQLADLLKYDKALNRNDANIKEVIEEFTDNLAIGISNIINIFEPDIVGIGGSFAYFEEFLLEKLKQKILCGNLLFNRRDDIIIKSAVLANDAGIIGASML